MPRGGRIPGWRSSRPCWRAPARTPSSASRRRNGACRRAGSRSSTWASATRASAPTPASSARSSTRSPEVSGYPLAQGLPELREAIAGWAYRRFDARLDPETEVIPTYGSKEAIFSLALALLDRDAGRRTVAYTEPAYPVYERGALFAGGEPLGLPLEASSGFLPDLDAVDWDGVALLWVNYPNNPTGAVAGARLLRACRRARAPTRLRARLGRGVHRAVVRPAAAVGASGRGPYERARVQQPLEALLDDRLPVRVSRPATPSSSRRCARSGRPSGRRRRSSSSGPPSSRGATSRTSCATVSATARSARCCSRPSRRRGCGSPAARRRIYLWVEVPAGETSEDFATRVLERGVVVAPGSYLGPTGEGYIRIALDAAHGRVPARGRDPGVA